MQDSLYLARLRIQPYNKKTYLVQTKEDCFQAVSPDQMGLRILHQVKIACPVILNSTGFPNYIVTTIAPFEAQFKTHFKWTLLVC